MKYLLFLPGILFIIHGLRSCFSDKGDSEERKDQLDSINDEPYVSLVITQEVPTVAEALRGKPKDRH